MILILYFYKKFIKRIFIASIAGILITLVSSNYINLNKTMKDYNSNKFHQLKEYGDEKVASLAIQVASGDKSYRNKELEILFKKNQILHLLVLSGGNIITILSFIHIFILRKSLNNYVKLIFIILAYLSYTNYSETLIRASLSVALSQGIVITGLKYSKLRIYFITLFIQLIVMLSLGLGTSFTLSVIFSGVISLYGIISTRKKLLDHLVLSIILSFVSYFIFSTDKYFSSYRTLLANLFITPIFEYANILIYLIYFLPSYEGITTLNLAIYCLTYIMELFIYLLDYWYLMLYNLCYEEI